MKHVLTLSPEYVANWNEWDAARELIQNAMDQAEQSGPPPIVRWQNGILTIGSEGGELSPKTLLLGVTTKAENNSQRGQFGEGFKLAMLVFARRFYEVKVRTGSEEWEAAIVGSKEYECQILQITRRRINGPPSDGVFFHIGGGSRKMAEPTWRLIESRYLPGKKEDEILTDRPGMIFSGGLFLCESKGLQFGYNFSPSRLAVGRDRSIVSGFDIEFATSQLWAATSQSTGDLYTLLRQDAKDTRYVSCIPASKAAKIAIKYEKDYGEGTAPVLDQKELDDARSQGLRAQIVPAALRKVISQVREFVFYDRTTPGWKMKEFFNKHQDRLDLDIREELQFLVNASQSWRS